MKIRLIFIALLCAATAGAVDLDTRHYYITNDVSSARPAVSPLRWYQGESVKMDLYVVRGAAAVDLSGSGLFPRWEAFVKNTTSNAYIMSTGTIAVATNGYVTFDLAPSYANLPTNNYDSYINIYQPVSGTNRFVGTVYKTDLQVLWGPAGTNHVYQGPFTNSTAPVLQLVAGTNITLSPASGLGTVTINATATAPSVTDVGYLASNQTWTGDNLFPDITLTNWLLDGTSYSNITDWVNCVQAAGIISGGTITNNGDGTIGVSAADGFIKTSNSGIGVTKFFHMAEDTSVTLNTNDAINYVYIDYNSGTPIVAVEQTKTKQGRSAFYLGKVFAEDTTLHILNAGQNITEAIKRIQSRFTGVEGEVSRASGSVISEATNRCISSTAGVNYAGLTRLTTDAQDTSAGDTFDYYYYTNSAWYKTSASNINNTQYNDVTVGLKTLNNNKYGVHWVYVDSSDGKLLVVYGQGDYSLAEAEAAQPPSSLPNHIAEMGFLAGKIIIQKSATTFYSLASAYDTQFTPSGAADHAELQHLDAASSGHTGFIFADGSVPMTGGLSLGGNSITNVGAVDATSLTGTIYTTAIYDSSLSDAKEIDVSNGKLSIGGANEVMDWHNYILEIAGVPTLDWHTLALTGAWTVSNTATTTTQIVNYQTMTNKIESYGYGTGDVSQAYVDNATQSLVNADGSVPLTGSLTNLTYYGTNGTFWGDGVINGTNGVYFGKGGTNYWILLSE